ncbi:hypothetical protein QT15_07705 [Pseudoalteromonas flavipulchra NCIMB 2033 = ATCC BAA-314]|nr:hypothetical protein QT15_07705 [Pseudoalteromonas flavipulchra NCIMB 2033 = ATCC BAA-314]
MKKSVFTFLLLVPLVSQASNSSFEKAAGFPVYYLKFAILSIYLLVCIIAYFCCRYTFLKELGDKKGTDTKLSVLKLRCSLLFFLPVLLVEFIL